MTKKIFTLCRTAILITLLFSACGLGSKQIVAESEEYPIFIPPTIVPTPTITPEPTLEIPDSPGVVIPEDQLDDYQQVDPNCTNDLKFIEDLTIEDGTHVVAGSTLDKQWEVLNSGTCNWGSGYSLVKISGSEMGVETDQKLIPSRGGTHATIRIIFAAPQESGNYTSAWQAADPDGQLFGEPIYIDIVVE